MTNLQLTYFAAACELHSFTKVAERYVVSQPSVSNSIKNLEQELGVTLFHHDTKSKTMLMTDHAQLLYPYAKEILASCTTVYDLMQQKNLRKTVYMGITSMSNTAIIAKIAGSFCPEHSNIRLNILEGTRDFIKDSLNSGRVELAIIQQQEIKEENYHYFTLSQNSKTFYIHKKFSLGNERKISIQDLKGIPLVMYSNDFATRRSLADMMRQNGVEDNVVCECKQFSTIEKLVLAGVGGTFAIPGAICQTDDIKEYEVEEHRSENKIQVIWRKDRPLTTQGKALLKTLRKLKEEFAAKNTN